MPIKRFHVCGRPGCPELTPCPKHSRPRNARWSENRDGPAHDWFAKQVMFRAGGVCERCHERAATQAHHVRPGYDPEHGLALCDDCHAALDNKARRTA